MKLAYWSELNSILDSLYGRATLVIAIFVPLRYLIPVLISEELVLTIKFAILGSTLILAANLVFLIYLPSVQRNYLRFYDYEKKCLDLYDRNALNLYEEYGCVAGKSLDFRNLNHSGLNFSLIGDAEKIPLIDEYKKSFPDDSKGCAPQLIRSLSAIKYLYYDVSRSWVRLFVLSLIILGGVLIYIPQLFGIIDFLVGS